RGRSARDRDLCRQPAPHGCHERGGDHAHSARRAFPRLLRQPVRSHPPRRPARDFPESLPPAATLSAPRPRRDCPQSSIIVVLGGSSSIIPCHYRAFCPTYVLRAGESVIF